MSFLNKIKSFTLVKEVFKHSDEVGHSLMLWILPERVTIIFFFEKLIIKNNASIP